MKYYLIILLFLLNGAFASYDSSSNAENCAYSTQDTHVVSENYYNRLLAQLNQSDSSEEEKKKRTNQSGGRGQR